MNIQWNKRNFSFVDCIYKQTIEFDAIHKIPSSRKIKKVWTLRLAQAGLDSQWPIIIPYKGAALEPAPCSPKPI